MVELDHTFSTDKAPHESWKAILDLERLIPCVQGGRVLELAAPEQAKAEIHVRMGEGVVVSVLDALINDFTGRLAAM